LQSIYELTNYTAIGCLKDLLLNKFPQIIRGQTLTSATGWLIYCEWYCSVKLYNSIKLFVPGELLGKTHIWRVLGIRYLSSLILIRNHAKYLKWPCLSFNLDKTIHHKHSIFLLKHFKICTDSQTSTCSNSVDPNRLMLVCTGCMDRISCRLEDSGLPQIKDFLRNKQRLRLKMSRDRKVSRLQCHVKHLCRN
jgi:hypothetical protein